MPQQDSSQSTPPPPSEDRKPIGEQVADLILKAIKPGGVTVGGIGAFWCLLVQSDVPKAVMSAGIGVGLSYGAKLLDPIHKGNQRRLDATGKAIDKGIDDGIKVIDDSFKQMLTYLSQKARNGTPEERYLACQALECQAVKSEGVIQYDGIFKPLLAEVFVSLAIDMSATTAGFNSCLLDDVVALDPEEVEQRRRQLTIWEFLARSPSTPTFRQLAILA